ncbi:MAG: diacylglycerol kinase family protein [Candidatus Buchananbacteria bacterium]|nr:diacylglycerol kinase family protein [Candidatus Buchananbacteria bacterium]
MKKVFVIFNPTAGLKSRIDVEGIVRDKLDNLGYKVHLFYLNNHFEDEISGFDFSGTDLVVAVGGDGTVKVATKIIIDHKLTAPLAIIPYGSANVIAMAAGIPTNIRHALKLIDKSNRIIAIDVGRINKKHYFIVGLSIGYISKVVIGASHHLKNKFGFFGYLLVFLFNKIKIRKLKFEIKTKNRSFWVKGNSLIVFNTLNYYGLKIKKPISFADGVFNLYVFTNKTFVSLLETIILMIFYNRPPRYILALDNNYFKIILKKESDSCQIDGDYIKLPRVIEVEVLPQALNIIT